MPARKYILPLTAENVEENTGGCLYLIVCEYASYLMRYAFTESFHAFCYLNCADLDLSVDEQNEAIEMEAEYLIDQVRLQITLSNMHRMIPDPRQWAKFFTGGGNHSLHTTLVKQKYGLWACAAVFHDFHRFATEYMQLFVDRTSLENFVDGGYEPIGEGFEINYGILAGFARIIAWRGRVVDTAVRMIRDQN